MRNIMGNQQFTHHLSVIEMLKESEKLFAEIQSMKRYDKMLFIL